MIKLPILKHPILVMLGGVFLVLSGYLVISHLTVYRQDSRPVKKILFIGNSRTYVNNLPVLLLTMAESTASPVRYVVTMHALGGHTFEDHNTNPIVKKLLDTQWDYVVLQGGSPENTNPDSSESFLTHGKALIQRIQQQQSKPVLLVAWTYDENSYDYENEHYLKPDYENYLAKYQQYIEQYGKPPANKPAPDTFYPLDIKKHFVFIQNDYQTLADPGHVLKVNVGEAFQQLLASNSSFARLTTDGNHPNMQGSYLAAAMLHVCFAKVPAQSIRYVPNGLSKQGARAIQLFIDQFYPQGTCKTSILSQTQ